jgi:DNA-binding beta-propeller fold protein YncE
MRFWCLQSRIVSSVCCLLIAAMAACSHGQQTGPAQQLYAAIPETALIAVYPANSSGNAQPLATIKEKPPDKPVDVSVDLSGEVFVANENGNVRAFGGRNYRYELIHSLEGPHTRIQHPTAIVTDSAGSFYISEPANSTDKARVEWFPGGQNGNVFPNREISGPRTGIVSPRGLALDGSGRLFVADEASNKVLVFDADAAGDTVPIAVLTGFKSPEHVFVDQLLNVYVSSRGDDSIAVFITSGPKSWTRSATVKSTAMHQPEGVAADQEGRIAVSTTGGVLFFAAGSDGQVEPIANLRGPSPMNPAGIFIH